MSTLDDDIPSNTPMVALEPISDDQALAFAQSTRQSLVKTMTQHGMPNDNNDRNTILRALEGMTSTALGNKRMKVDKDISDAQSQAKQVIGRMFGILGSDNPFKSQNPIERHLKIPDTLDKDFVAVPGETEIGVSVENFDSFADKHGIKK